MAIPNPPEDRPAGEPVPGKDEYEHDHASAPAMSGTGLSVALSVACYLIVLAVGIGYDHTHRLRSPRSDAPDTSSADWLASVHASIFPLMPFEAIGPIRILLARAHDCALAGQWNCVDAATRAAIALRGDAADTPEAPPDAQTLLAQASANEMWASSRAMNAGPAYIGRNGQMKVAAHARAAHGRWRPYRHQDVSIMARKTTARRALPVLIADLYRH
ncbi:MAG TPA: hypothetical protein VJS18_02470 [Paraburkholderia sp.]|nr:hypothetical protein [Paraburkholderia sp.]